MREGQTVTYAGGKLTTIDNIVEIPLITKFMNSRFINTIINNR